MPSPSLCFFHSPTPKVTSFSPYHSSAPMGAHLKLLLFSAFLFLNSVPTTRSLTESESVALIDLRSSLGISSRNWHKKENPCSNWTGIQCSNGRVTRIHLSGLRRTRQGKTNPRFAIDSLPNFTSLSSFNSSGFSLPGPIPEWFGYKLSNLQVLDLGSSSISGSIPSSIGHLNRLTYLRLSNNSIAGTIPLALGNISSLSVLDLSLNLLMGQIPTEVRSLGNLSKLDLSSNFLSGAVEFSSFSSTLRYLNLSVNSLSGSIPAHLRNLFRLVELDLGYNSLSGPLPVEIGGLTNLSKIIVRNNLLEGRLPLDLFRNLTRLEYVDFSSNNLTGFLPNINSTLAGSVFNISDNHFYGNLSLSSGIRNFHVVDLSSNYLQGPAPKFNVVSTNNCFSGPPGQRRNEDCVNFYSGLGLSFLYSGPQRLPKMQPSGGKKRLVYVMIGVFGGLGLIILVLTSLFLIRRSCWTKRAKNDSVDSDEPGPGVSYTYEQMRMAMRDFSLLKRGRSGDLFKGELEGAVVVKKVNESDIELLGKIVHRRLVPVVGHCVKDENEKFLVYKYMVNGDLSSALYLRSLDWITRLKIAIGAAEGLSYLHHECSPPLAHRDVQASSILLDDKYEVRLGSLSEVCVPGAMSHQNAITRLLRSQTSRRRPSGSVPSIAFADDVYCFGKVLLELVTGKIGISSPSEPNAKQWIKTDLSFVTLHEKELVTKILDQSLMVDEDLLEEVWAVAIVAKSCLNRRASKRPLMRHVLRALENPFKVVRGESFSIDRLRAVSSRQSWTAAIFGSWYQSSSGSSNASSGKSKEVVVGGLRVGSRSSGAHEHSFSTSHKRSSSEVFPEPLEVGDGVC